MAKRNNQRVGVATRIMIALSIALVIVAIAVAATAIKNQRAAPQPGSSALPGQAAKAGVQPGGLPSAN